MFDSGFSGLMPPPYYAVVFSSEHDDPGYGGAAQRMIGPARQQPGFLGAESARGDDGPGISASYWRSEEAIRAWRRHAGHAATRERGRRDWYECYALRVAKVERAYGWNRPAETDAP
ncbi:antibiotic biosynthesis monooxygenase family protein [Luteimonas sp. R10]|uniref:antibiotic biosynthesis monooxygenase family protein n=1 Tax=Luteimonas sp. R10 TaxID=3108176 RepID=UPI00308ACC4E|nr:antibiotic biosynthesis monooxygenase [Luteimonas sp. R10]